MVCDTTMMIYTQKMQLILLKTMVILCPKNQSFFWLLLATTNKPISFGVLLRYFFLGFFFGQCKCI